MTAKTDIQAYAAAGLCLLAIEHTTPQALRSFVWGLVDSSFLAWYVESPR